MFSEQVLGNAIRSALLIGAGSSLFIANAANAAAGENASVERIEVTGSRINRTDIETASPVTVISSAFIAQSGYNSVEEILSAQPTAAGMNLGATTNNGSGGSATVNLRGMGVQRTLVLLNGRRMVSSGTGADSAVDLNTIPVAMIQNIEILKDGASAVYGSDAIAGVVNIITKKDFVGTELTLDASQTDKGDGTSKGISILHGLELAQGNLVVGLQYSDRGEIIQSDRDFVEPGASSFIPTGSLGGLVADGAGGLKPRDTSYDYTDDSYAQTPNELFSVFSAYNTELDSDTELSFDFMYTRRESNQQMAPQPANLDLASNKLDALHLTNIQAAYDKLNADIADPTKHHVIEDTVNYRRRMTDAGPRIFSQETDTYRASIGLKGYLDNDAMWDISATYGRNDSKDSVQNSIHAGNMISSIYQDQNAWFSGDAMANSDLAAQGILYTEENEGGNKQFTLAAGFSGVTASDIGYAIGFETRHESGYYTPDEITQRGESTAAQQFATDGDYSVQSIYGEISVPVTEQLTFEAASRYDEYSTFGGEITWKLGATYRLNDAFMIRSVAATGFRAPSVSELYGGDSGSYDYLSDPWGNELDAQIKVNYTSDENLQPEESESFTFGMVWEVMDGLSTTVDYWAFDITNAISRVDVQQELNACFNGISAACSGLNITADGDLSALTSQLTNIGSQETSGVDWNISYSHDLFKVALDTTFLIEFEQDGTDYTGTIDGNIGGYADIKSNLSVYGYVSDDLTVLYNAQFISGMDGEYYGQPFATDDVVYHNISAAYHINDQWVVNAGVKNLFDKEPEAVLGGNDMGTVPSIYDVIGRNLFISTSYQF
ncbi:iron complex outermembrane recepter protein [Colwellia chukchiensis]|uniref:Iron complex outermembrane recepter protein n=1 Tax=Colwellia chukchiensis TaxID=641665 RepID=A0A1H7PAE3_9GAMM|nr:TonB-dependent receptor [Colwellia chukchiensis]SEL32408.1 iron complex outermembrane recepter protein [Colwellia chukchiensis]